MTNLIKNYFPISLYTNVPKQNGASYFLIFTQILIRQNTLLIKRWGKLVIMKEMYGII